MGDRKLHWWNRFIPNEVRNPLLLASTLLRVDNSAGRYAMLLAAAGIALTPLERLMIRSEQRRYEHAPLVNKPVILVVGPPRSGTTLVAQYLINVFDVAYLNNLTALFPRAPIRANELFGKLAPLGSSDYSAYYGKTRGLSGANDGLYIWDRWLGAHRDEVPNNLVAGARESIPKFFGALQAHYNLSVVTKVNRLNCCAHLIADSLPTAMFVCLKRDPLYLAQSLYIARQEILSDLRVPYGVRHSREVAADPIEDVCQQVIFHDQQARIQQERIGKERYFTICYEAFCDRPSALAHWLKRKYPELRFRMGAPDEKAHFKISRKRTLPPELLSRLEQKLHELQGYSFNNRKSERFPHES